MPVVARTSIMWKAPMLAASQTKRLIKRKNPTVVSRAAVASIAAFNGIGKRPAAQGRKKAPHRVDS